MRKVDLITGFLGSGKTTFLKRYADYLIRSGGNIGIIENDHGAVNVDMLLLQELLGTNCDLEMVTGGCDLETHMRRLKTKLISFGMRGAGRVLVEPSGIFDVDEFFDVLREEPLDRWYEIGSVIAIVDAKLEDDLSEQSNYMLASQIANAGKVIISRSQESTRDDLRHTIRHLNEVMEMFGCKNYCPGIHPKFPIKETRSRIPAATSSRRTGTTSLTTTSPPSPPADTSSKTT